MAKTKQTRAIAEKGFGVKFGNSTDVNVFCPFHEEPATSTTKSCSVNVKGIFNCKGCTARGTVYQFYAKRKNLTNKQAHQLLGKRTAAAVPYSSPTEKKAVEQQWEKQQSTKTLLEEKPARVMKRTQTFFPYPDNEDGTQVGVRRIDFPDGRKKECRPYHLVKGKRKIGGTIDHLYKLDELLKSKNGQLLVVEGETKVNLLIKKGFTATCNPLGALAWKKKHSTQLKHYEGTIVVIPDEDAQGMQHAIRIRKSLQDIGATKVKIVRLLNLPSFDGADVVDFFVVQKRTVKELRQIIDKTPLYQLTYDRLVSIKVSDVPSEPILWNWSDHIARGKLNEIVSDVGYGKTRVMLDIIARTTNTTLPMPDGSTGTYGEVIMFDRENGLRDVIRPALKAAGADLNKIYFIEQVDAYDDEGNLYHPYFTFAQNIPLVEKLLIEKPNVVLVTIDSISQFIGDVDTSNQRDVQSVLAQLDELARKYEVGVLMSVHKNKRSGEVNPIYTIMGSVGFGAQARMIWSIERDKDDDERRLLLCIKTSLTCEKDARGLAFRFDVNENKVPIVAWEPQALDTNARDFYRKDKKPTKGQQVANILKTLLAKGPRLSTDVREDVEGQMPELNDYAWWRGFDVAKIQMSKMFGGKQYLYLQGDEHLMSKIKSSKA